MSDDVYHIRGVPQMSKFYDLTANVQLFGQHNRMFDIRSFSLPQKTFDDINGDLRLRRMLKRAVEQERAPKSLINSIRLGIRG